MKAVLRSFACITLASLGVGVSAADAQLARVGVVTAVHGAATLTRVSLPDSAPLRFKDDIYVADRITTGDEAYARILLGGKAVVTVRERSALTIKEVPGSATIDVTRGKVALAVIKERMKPGEQIEIRTPNAVAGIRGTVVVTEVAPAAAGVLSTITVLQGLIEVFQLDPHTGQPVGAGIPVGANQSVQVTGFMAPRAVQQITTATRRRLSDEFSLNLKQPRGGAPGLVKSQMQQAAALTDQLLSKDTEREQVPSASVSGIGQDVLGTVGQALGSATGGGAGGATAAGGGSVLAPLASGVSATGSAAGGLLSGTTSALGGALTGTTGALGGALTGTTSALGGTLTGTTGALGGALTGTTGALGGALGGPLGGTVSGVGGALGSTTTSLGGALGSTTTSLGSTLGSTTTSLGGALGGTTSSVGDTAGGLLGGVTKGVGGLLK